MCSNDFGNGGNGVAPTEDAVVAAREYLQRVSSCDSIAAIGLDLAERKHTTGSWSVAALRSQQQRLPGFDREPST